jgi:SAM-dependent methyltransferase
MMLRFLENFAKRMLERKYLCVERRQEGLVTKGEFVPTDFSRYKVVDGARFLSVEKGRYKIAYRTDRQRGGDGLSPGMLVLDNSRPSYDEFWQADEVVDGYEEPARKRFFSEVLDACDTHIHGAVVDVGCGSGYFLKLIQSRLPNCAIHGIDFSSSSVRRCKRTITDGMFSIGDVFNLACRDNSFDTVICMETLEHIEFPHKAVEEIFRICRQAGTVIMTIPNGCYDDYIGHLNFWSEAEFKALLGVHQPAEVHYLSGKKDMVFIVKK